MSLLVVGSVALDTVETPSGKREDALGGSATFFSTAASLFHPVQLVAVVGDDFPAEHVEFLQKRGVDLTGLVRTTGKTFRWKGRYGAQLNEAHTLDTQLNVFADFAPKLPVAFQSPEIVFLGNIDPVLQGRVVAQVKRPKLVAADTMNFWITGKREALLETLKMVDLLFVNDAEARALAGESNVVTAARAIQRMGPKRVCIKRGEYGALLFNEGEVVAAPAFPVEDVRDPTGAGDTFAGGFLGSLARGGDLSPAAFRRAVATGSVVASFTVEEFSLDRLRDLTLDALRGRYAALQQMVDIGPVGF